MSGLIIVADALRFTPSHCRDVRRALTVSFLRHIAKRWLASLAVELTCFLVNLIVDRA
jgi:hypothetical protein